MDLAAIIDSASNVIHRLLQLQVESLFNTTLIHIDAIMIQVPLDALQGRRFCWQYLLDSKICSWPLNAIV